MTVAGSIAQCPECGDPGFVNPNTGERQCSKVTCDYTEPLTPAVEMVTIPAVDFRGALARCAEADQLLRAAYADAHPEDVPADVLLWLNPDTTGGQ